MFWVWEKFMSVMVHLEGTVKTLYLKQGLCHCGNTIANKTSLKVLCVSGFTHTSHNWCDICQWFYSIGVANDKNKINKKTSEICVK